MEDNSMHTSLSQRLSEVCTSIRLILFFLVVCVASIAVAGCMPGDPFLASPNAVSTPTPLLGSFNLSVQVIDETTDTPIIDAEIVLQLQERAPLTGRTDSNGYGRIFVPDTYIGMPGVLRVQSGGYTPYEQQIDLRSGQLPERVILEPATILLTEEPAPICRVIHGEPNLPVTKEPIGPAFSETIGGVFVGATLIIEGSVPSPMGTYYEISGFIFGGDRNTKVIDIEKSSPAAEAGVEVGDIILQLDDTRIHSAREVADYILANSGRDVRFHVLSNGQIETKVVHVRRSSERLADQGATGITIQGGDSGLWRIHGFVPAMGVSCSVIGDVIPLSDGEERSVDSSASVSATTSDILYCDVDVHEALECAWVWSAPTLLPRERTNLGCLSNGTRVKVLEMINNDFGYYRLAPQIVAQPVTVVEVMPFSPAAQIGMQKGDVVVRIDDLQLDKTPTETWREYVRTNAGKDIDLTIIREGQELSLSVTPSANPPEGEGPIGFTYEGGYIEATEDAFVYSPMLSSAISS